MAEQKLNKKCKMAKQKKCKMAKQKNVRWSSKKNGGAGLQVG
jgi:hypothetical protein